MLQVLGWVLLLGSVCVPRVTPECVFASLTKKLPGSVGYFEILPREERTQTAHQICLCGKRDCGLFGSSTPPLY